MTKENGLSHVKYLDAEDIAVIYGILETRFKKIGEPIPSFALVNKAEIENLVALPQTKFYQEEQYNTFEAKAVILFYKINKGHIFPNGNKRMSIACLLVFLAINDYDCDLTEDELTEKAIWLAKSDAAEFERVKKDLETWIQAHCAFK